MADKRLIVIEGACDGIGKSTQFEMLKKRLESEGKEVVTHHFPTYNTPSGALTEEYLKGNMGPKENLNPYVVHNFYAADRASIWNTKLKKAYEAGKIILLDRYTTSSLIYQSVSIKDENEKKAFIDFVTNYEYNILQVKKPDVVIFLNASYELVKKMREDRKENEGIVKDIHEIDNNFQKAVYDNANYIAKYLNWDIINCETNGTMRSVEEIHEDIFQKIRK